MSQDDPFASFGDEDKTTFRRPSPGGRIRSPAANAYPAEPMAAAAGYGPVGSPEWEAGRLAAFGDNPVVAAALSLLSVAARLRNTAIHRDIEGLQHQLVGEIRSFENRILQEGLNQEHVRLASYAICSLLDEAILNTPWGSQSIWGHQSLLILFHKEAWGGEKFFKIVEYLARQPAQNLPLIELCYLCLSLGFGGKYRVMPNGLNALEQYRAELYQLIQQQRGDFERALSPRWKGLEDIRNPLMRAVPLWVLGAVAAAVLVLVYLAYLFAINGVSDPVFRQLFALPKEEIRIAALPAPSDAPHPTGRAERFKVLLAKEIDSNMVEVVDDRILRIRGSFDSGSDRVKDEFTPMLEKIARELVSGHDHVLVTGHTDDIPIRSARFPSNFELSKSRARHVLDLLAKFGVPNASVRFEGRADAEPLVSNDTPEHRAFNRRVDLLIQ